MSLKAVANNPATGNHGTGGAARDHSETAASTIDPQTATPDLPVPEALAIRMPVDIRSAALTVLAVLAIVLVLQYAQAMIIPIVLGGAHQLRAGTGHRLAGAAARSPRAWRRGRLALAGCRRRLAALWSPLPGDRDRRTTAAGRQAASAVGGKRPADRGLGDPAGTKGRHRAGTRGELRDASTSADRDSARAGRDAADQDQRLPHVGIPRCCRCGGTARADPVPRVLPAVFRRPLSAKAREDCGTVADGQESDGANPPGDRPSDRDVPDRRSVHEPGRGTCDLARIPARWESSRPRSGVCWRACSTRSRTSGR